MVGMTQHPIHPQQQDNREALKDLVEEIRHEYPNAETLTLRQFCGHLTVEQLKEDTGYAYGLDDCDSLFEAARSVDLSDPSWTSGVAEAVVLEGGTPGWIISLPAAAAVFKLA